MNIENTLTQLERLELLSADSLDVAEFYATEGDTDSRGILVVVPEDYKTLDGLEIDALWRLEHSHKGGKIRLTKTDAGFVLMYPSNMLQAGVVSITLKLQHKARILHTRTIQLNVDATPHYIPVAPQLSIEETKRLIVEESDKAKQELTNTVAGYMQEVRGDLEAGIERVKSEVSAGTEQRAQQAAQTAVQDALAHTQQQITESKDELNSKIEERGREFSESLELKADKSELDSLALQVTSKADNAQIATLQQALQDKADSSALDTKADKSELEAKADKSELNALGAQLANKAENTQIEALRQAIENKADAASLEAKADRSELANKADRSELQEKADKASLDLKADKTELNSKADKSELDRYQLKGEYALKSDLEAKVDNSDIERMRTDLSQITRKALDLEQTKADKTELANKADTTEIARLESLIDGKADKGGSTDSVPSGDYATNESLKAEIKKLVGTAPDDLDTLGELADRLKSNESTTTSLAEQLESKVDKTTLDTLATKEELKAVKPSEQTQGEIEEIKRQIESLSVQSSGGLLPAKTELPKGRALKDEHAGIYCISKGDQKEVVTVTPVGIYAGGKCFKVEVVGTARVTFKKSGSTLFPLTVNSHVFKSGMNAASCVSEILGANIDGLYANTLITTNGSIRYGTTKDTESPGTICYRRVSFYSSPPNNKIPVINLGGSEEIEEPGDE